LIEPFLATRKLEAQSPKARKFLADAVRATLVFNRLLEYGVPLMLTPDLFEQMISVGNGFLVKRMLSTTVGLNALVRSWSDEDQVRVVNAAIRRCQFDVANTLLDRGFNARDPSGWANLATESCSDDRWFPGPEAKTRAQEQARVNFLTRLANVGTH
jgi:hypothetical protein